MRRIPAAGYLVLITIVFAPARGQGQAAETIIALDAGAILSIVSGSVEEPVAELRQYLKQITGTEFVARKREKGEVAKPGIHVGLIKDFPELKIENAVQLGLEGFVIRTTNGSVYLVAAHPRGVQHAVTTFLHRLGCRWFFPGKTWEVVPRLKTISGNWNERHTPAFRTQRRIWYGYGAYATGKRDHAAWERHNRMAGPIPISIGHTWHGLKPEKEFADHPDWFALVKGKRQTTKPCYSHAKVIERAIESGLKQAASGKAMISMTPPDGLGYCECERCRAVFKGGKPFASHGSLFAKRPDGVLVNITSETLFAMVNKVAEAVAAKYPKALVGCYAYSAYSHPPSFALHPNVYLQTTTAYRRTPITLERQIGEFGKKTQQVGIREYYSVYQWDWDYPNPGKMTPEKIAEDLRFFHKHGVTAINAEASNNWGPRGLAYYVASQLMWDVNADVKQIMRDFYRKAFGPAAGPMQRYYVRWYGAGAAVPGEAGASKDAGVRLYEKGKFDVEALRGAYRDLDAAMKLVPADSAYRKRIDLLRMYAHYLFLRYRLHQAEQAEHDSKGGAIVDAIKAETLFGVRLADTHMIHVRPLAGKAFLRRFRKHEKLLADVAEAQQAHKGWRTLGQPPAVEELDKLWASDKAALGIE